MSISCGRTGIDLNGDFHDGYPILGVWWVEFGQFFSDNYDLLDLHLTPFNFQNPLSSAAANGGSAVYVTDEFPAIRKRFAAYLRCIAWEDDGVGVRPKAPKGAKWDNNTLVVE